MLALFYYIKVIKQKKIVIKITKNE